MKITNIAKAGAALSVLGFASLASAQMQNPNSDTTDDIIVVEEDMIVTPAPDMSNGNNWQDRSNLDNTRANTDRNSLNQATTRGLNNPSAGSSNVPSSDFNRNVNNGTNVNTPDNQPMVDKALKNQNPTYNGGNNY